MVMDDLAQGVPPRGDVLVSAESAGRQASAADALDATFNTGVDRGVKRRQVKPLAASLLDALDYDSSDDSDFEVGDAT
ncbi:hypothetical protein KUCAC02_035020, partial [Chaenocephalus aceratus]